MKEFKKLNKNFDGMLRSFRNPNNLKTKSLGKKVIIEEKINRKMKLCNTFYELVECKKKLELHLSLIRASHKINVSSHHLLLRTFFECFFHDLYILKERLISFINLIKKADLETSNKKELDGLRERIYKKLEIPIEFRRKHVHEFFVGTSLFGPAYLMHVFGGEKDMDYDKECRELKKKICSILTKEIDRVDQAVEDFSKTVREMIFIKGALKV